MVALCFYLKNHVVSGGEQLPPKKQDHIPSYIYIRSTSVICMYIFCICNLTLSAFKRYTHQ